MPIEKLQIRVIKEFKNDIVLIFGDNQSDKYIGMVYDYSKN